ncbi:MAG: Do family serine endopeptidase, partial [Alphaproteobacteria bacterium]|nr:Do family serine endopeptidase [Alphaproteobacteria bacterium]
PPPSGFADMVEKLAPAVVNIRSLRIEKIRDTSQTMPPDLADMLRHFGYNVPPSDNNNNQSDSNKKNNNRRELQRSIAGLGSGFLISPSGLVVTNNHVINRASEIKVTLSNDKSYTAKVIGTDDRSDLALLKIDGTKLPYVSFGDSDKMRVGDWVIAIGDPAGLGGSVSAGIVSGLGRNINATRYDNLIQTDAAINRGNSGGPLFNMKGEVIGINSIIFSETGGNIGIGFAIPANQATVIIEQIKTYGTPKRSWLGVAMQELDENLSKQFDYHGNDGALVLDIFDDSPASHADIKTGDIIITVNGQSVKNAQTLTRLVALEKSNKPIVVKIWRNGATLTKMVTLTPLIKSDEEISSGRIKNLKKIQGGGTVVEKPGLAIRALTPADRDILSLPTYLNGVMVSALTSNKDNQEGGLANSLTIGTIIFSIDDTPLTNVAMASNELKKYFTSGKPFQLFIYVPGSGFAILKVEG